MPNYYDTPFGARSASTWRLSVTLLFLAEKSFVDPGTQSGLLGEFDEQLKSASGETSTSRGRFSAHAT